MEGALSVRTLLRVALTMALMLSSYAGSSARTSSVTVTLSQLYGSGEAGTAVFSQASDGVHVVMSLAGAPSGVDQPAHIHIGTCTKNVATQWVLHNLINGKSVSTLRGITLAELTSGKYVV